MILVYFANSKITLNDQNVFVKIIKDFVHVFLDQNKVLMKSVQIELLMDGQAIHILACCEQGFMWPKVFEIEFEF